VAVVVDDDPPPPHAARAQQDTRVAARRAGRMPGGMPGPAPCATVPGPETDRSLTSHGTAGFRTGSAGTLEASLILLDEGCVGVSG
jgi:hypothetical protein